MKKIFALTVAVMTILTCFTACKPKIKNGIILQDQAGDVVAAVTKKDGGLARDEAGNIIKVELDYTEKYDEQMLRYSRDYNFLPDVNE